MSYTIKLDGGKYEVINHDGSLEFRRNGQLWPATQDLRHCGVLLAMAQRIEELETELQEHRDSPYSLPTTTTPGPEHRGCEYCSTRDGRSSGHCANPRQAMSCGNYR